MGGKVFPDLSRRMGADEYHATLPRILENLEEALAMNENQRPRMAAIPAYRTKESFGDADILVDSSTLPANWLERISLHLAPAAMKRNGNVVSMVYGHVPGLQVDIILSPAHEFDFALNYFSWNDAGNLVGRIAHKMGLKFGHNGLWLPCRDGDHLFATIAITQDFPKAISFLGYDPVRWNQGFDTLTDLYEFVASGARFSPEIYLLENRDAKSRVRDKKRPTYMGFLEWMRQHPEKALPKQSTSSLQTMAYPKDKSLWIPEILAAFPQARSAWEKAHADKDRAQAIKQRFNGDRIAELTQLRGMHLGAFMGHLRERFSDPHAFFVFAVEMSDGDFDNMIKDIHKKWVPEGDFPEP